MSIANLHNSYIKLNGYRVLNFKLLPIHFKVIYIQQIQTSFSRALFNIKNIKPKLFNFLSDRIHEDFFFAFQNHIFYIVGLQTHSITSNIFFNCTFMCVFYFKSYDIVFWNNITFFTSTTVDLFYARDIFVD